jgi:hypothetical protein
MRSSHLKAKWRHLKIVFPDQKLLSRNHIKLQDEKKVTSKGIQLFGRHQIRT